MPTKVEKVIDAPMIVILRELQSELKNGKLKDVVDHRDNIAVTCPIHKGGFESKPGCMIYAKKDGKVEYGTAHCFMAGTKIPTMDGIKNIEELVGKDVFVINGNGEWEKTRFGCYGLSPILDITLSRDKKVKHVYATPEHEWFVQYRKSATKTEKLLKNTYLESVIPPKRDFTLVKEAVQWGIIFADGYISNQYETHLEKGTKKRIKNKNNIIGYTYKVSFSKKTHKPLLAKYFENDNMWRIRETKRENDEFVSIFSKKFSRESINMKKSLPTMDYGRDFVLSFLAGYFACDGSVSFEGFSTVNEETSNKLRDLFISCGIAIRDCTKIVRDEGKTFLKDKKSTLYTTSIIYSTVPDTFFLLEEKLHKKIRTSGYVRLRWKVESVRPYSKSELVYCCETSTNSFVIEENILTHNCMVCHYSAKLPKFIEDCFGEQDGFGAQWLEERYGDIFIDKPIEFPIFGEEEQKEEQQFLDESILKEYDYYHPYMWKRKLTKEVVDKFHIGYDMKHKSITFPVWDDKGRLVMITERSVLTKHFFIPNGVQKPVYLLNFIKNEGINTVLIVESQINCLTAWSYGIPAVALFGTGSKYQYEILKKSGIRNYILCFDGDEAGRKGADKFKMNMRKNVFITDVEMPPGKDVNDMDKDEFLALLKTYGINYGS